MTKRRITLVVDDDKRNMQLQNDYMAIHVSGISGVTVESVEDLPAPRHQRFRVDVETEIGTAPVTREDMDRALWNHDGGKTKVTVTEVEPTT